MAKKQKIVEDGDYLITPSQHGYSSGTIVVSGSGSLTLGYVDEDDVFIPLTDGVLAPGEQYQIQHGNDFALVGRASGASGGLLVEYYGKN